MDLISVIVPVYKVEKYLDKCVESIVNQTYQNLEIILVDDGSPDSCPQMCDDWAKKDSRIKVIHKENGGLSDARNAGMAIATGEYIGFVDSDDYIAPEMYEKLYTAIKQSKSDIASCGAVRVWEDDTPNREMIRVREDFVLQKEEAMKEFIQSTCLIQTVWNKLYKKNCIKDILFEKGKIHEDEFWTWQAIANADRVVVIKESYYYYLQRISGIMGSGYTGRALLVLEANLARKRYIDSNMPQLSDLNDLHLLYYCYNQATEVIKYVDRNTKNSILKSIKNIVKQCNINSKFLKSYSLKKRVRIWMIRHFFIEICKLDVFIKLV